MNQRNVETDRISQECFNKIGWDSWKIYKGSPLFSNFEVSRDRTSPTLVEIPGFIWFSVFVLFFVTYDKLSRYIEKSKELDLLVLINVFVIRFSGVKILLFRILYCIHKL